MERLVGENPPFHTPVFVLTHHPRAPLDMEGGTTFVFVTDGIESALDQARQAASGRDVLLGGGANAVQQYLAAGLVDEFDLQVVPLLLGDGEPLFRDLGDLKDAARGGPTARLRPSPGPAGVGRRCGG